MTNAVVIGKQRLHHCLPSNVAAASPARNLGEQLKGALAGAKLGQAETDVRGNHADQRDPRKIVPFGDHLRADQHVDFPGGKPCEERGNRASPADRVAVDSRDARLGKRLAHFSFDTFGAETD